MVHVRCWVLAHRWAGCSPRAVITVARSAATSARTTSKCPASVSPRRSASLAAQGPVLLSITPTTSAACSRTGSAGCGRVGDTFEINGRTYGVHDGTLFPMSGPGFHQLNRGAFQALGVLNKFGDTPQAHAILGRMKNVGPDEVAAAMKAWRAGQ